MQKFIANIVLFAVSALVNGLKLIPGINPATFKEAIETAKTALDNAVAEYEANPDAPIEATVETLAHDGLQIAYNALEAKGDSNAAGYVLEADDFVVALEKNNGHPIVAAIKAAWDKLVHHAQPAQ